MKKTVFWDVALCVLAETDRHFRGAYCIIMAHRPVNISSKYFNFGEISGSHGSEYEDDSLLGCCAM
jgi:hypothetical protein